MTWTATNAITWSERGIALALVLQTIELLQIREAYADTGIWRWQDLAAEHQQLPAPLRWLFAVLLPYPYFIGLLIVRLLGAVAMPFSGACALLPMLCISQIAICVRFRGTFNGGSDSMTLLILTSLSLAEILRETPLAENACLLYIAAQATLSYFIAGISKLKETDWRNGTALCDIVTATSYSVPRWACALVRHRNVSQVLSWFVICFECLFPFGWLDLQLSASMLIVGLGFHIANWLVFGLNRFVFAWAATYPALLYSSAWLAGSR